MPWIQGHMAWFSVLYFIGKQTRIAEEENCSITKILAFEKGVIWGAPAGDNLHFSSSEVWLGDDEMCETHLKRVDYFNYFYVGCDIQLFYTIKHCFLQRVS